MSAAPLIPVSLTSSSGHDSDFSSPFTTLVNLPPTPDIGFISPKFTRYPATLLFSLPNHAALTHLRLLSHSTLVSKRIDISIGTGSSPATSKFRRLGYLSPSPPSSTRQRELKSANLSATGNYLRLTLHAPHSHTDNFLSQVGVAALEVRGEYTGRDEEVSREDSGGGLLPSPPTTREREAGLEAALAEPLPFKGGRGGFAAVDAEMLRRADAVASAKADAVRNQDYSRAKAAKSAEASIREAALACDRLIAAKAAAVAAEDYDRAIVLKGEISSTRQRAEEKMRALGIELPPLPEPEEEREGEEPAVDSDSPEDETPSPPPAPPLSLLEEFESDTMLASDPQEISRLAAGEPPTAQSPRLVELLNIAGVESPRAKDALREETEGEAKEMSPEETAAASAAAEEKIVDELITPRNPSAEEPLPAVSAPPRTPPSALPPLDLKEALAAKSYIENQLSPRVSPRVVQREPTPPATPPVWADEEEARVPSPKPDPVPTGEERANELSEWDEARNLIRQKSRQRRKKESAEVVSMSVEDEFTVSYNQQLIAEAGQQQASALSIQGALRQRQARAKVDHLRQIKVQTRGIVMMQATVRGQQQRRLVDHKRGVRKRTKNAFKKGLRMVQGMRNFAKVGLDGRARINALQDEEEPAPELKTASTTVDAEQELETEFLEPLDTLIDDPEVLQRAIKAAKVFGHENLQRIWSDDWKKREIGFSNISSSLMAVVKDHGGGGVEAVLSELCDVMIVGAEDKVANCMFKGMDVIEALEMCLREKSTAKWLKASPRSPRSPRGPRSLESPRSPRGRGGGGGGGEGEGEGEGGREKGEEKAAAAVLATDVSEEGTETNTLVPQLTKDVFCPLIESTVRALVGRLGDNHSGISDAALEALERIGSWPCCGAAFVAQIALKRLYKWEELMWRPVSNRLKLLERLLSSAVEEGSAGAGILAAASLKFANDCGAFESSHQAVEEAGKALGERAMAVMGENAQLMIGDLRGTSALAELQKAERARYVKLEKLVEKAKTQSMDLEHLSGNVQRTIDDVKASEEKVVGEVDELFDRIAAELEKRRQAVKSMVTNIMDGKSAALVHQKEDLDAIKTGIDETVAMSQNSMQMLHKEEYSTLIEPLTKHLEILGEQQKNSRRTSCDDSVVDFVGGSGEQLISGLVASFGAIYTSSDSLPGFGIEGGGGANNNENESGNKNAVVEKSTDGKEREKDVEMGRDIHLTVRALIPKNNGGLVGDAYHQAPPRDTVVVEVRRGSEREVARTGVDGEILGRVVIVNTIMSPPRDEYKVEQYFEQMYTRADLHEDFGERDGVLVKDRRSKVTHRNVPTTRFTKTINFTSEDSRWMKQLRSKAAAFSYQKELATVEEGLSPRVEEALWSDKIKKKR